MQAKSEHNDALVASSLQQRRAAQLRRRARHGQQAWVIGRHLLLFLAALPFVIPFYWLLVSSFKTNADLLNLPPSFWPRPWTFDDVQSAVGVSGFSDYVRNTAYITLFNVLATVVSSAIIAYPFARIRFPGRDALFVLVLVTLILPPWTTLIPTYYLYKWLGWLGTLRPVTWPALATTALFTFLWTYNDFFNPLIFLNDPSNYTLSLGVYQFVANHGIANTGAIMAYSLILTIPPIILFFFTQRTMIKGVTMSGLKF